MTNRKYRNLLLLAITVFVVIAIGCLVFIKVISNRNNYSISDEQIRIKFNCDRITADVRRTDIYCQFPNLYRNNTIDDTDLRKGLGCESKETTQVKNHPCLDQKAYEDYK